MHTFTKLERSEWEYFPLDLEVRPELNIVFNPEEKAYLERTIAEQVALLLSRYGDIVVNNYSTGYPENDEGEYVFYRVAELGDEEFADGTIFCITQLPTTERGDCDTRPGVYAIEHVTEESERIRNLTVRDPSHQVDRFVYDDAGQEVDLDVLQELYEALAVLTRSYMEEAIPNDPVIDPTSFPILVDNPIDNAKRLRLLASRLSGAPDYRPDISLFFESN